MVAAGPAAGAGPKLPIPPDLVSILPRPEIPWSLSQALFERMQKQASPAGKHFKTCEVWGSDPEYDFVLKYFMQSKPPGMSIRKILCIDNPGQTRGFEATLPAMEQAAQIFRPAWDEEEPKDLRVRVTKRWEEQASQFAPLELPIDDSRRERLAHIRVLPLWHGTRHVESICEIGFTYFGKHHLVQPSAGPGPAQKSTDIGYFGSGIYFTNSSKYAALYCPNTLMLSWVAMRRPYPVVSDVPIPQKCSDMRKLEGQGAYQNSNAHFIPVVSTDPSDPECMEYHPCSHSDTPTCDEFVVFQSTQALPRFCIELGIDLPAMPSGQTAHQILSAIEAVEIEALKKLSGAIPTLSQQDRNALLLAASSYGQVELCEALLTTGAQPAAINARGQNALHMAAEGNSVGIINMLLVYKDLLTTRNKEGRTPLLEAAWAGREEAFGLLVKAQSDLCAVGRYALHSAAKLNKVEVVQMLIAPKDSPILLAPNIIAKEVQQQLLEATTKDGWTPLLEAAFTGHVEVLRALLKVGANFRATTNDGQNVLHLSASKGHLGIVEIFTDPKWIPFLSEIDKEFQLHQKELLNARTNEEGQTPFLLASRNGHAAVCLALLNAGADIRARDGELRNALHLSATGGHLEVVQMLLIRAKSLLDEKLCFVGRYDLNATNPLSLAAREGHKAVCDALLKAGADPTAVDNTRGVRTLGWNALHHAAANGHLEVVQLLASDRRLLHAVSAWGDTPLLLASGYGCRALCEVLVKAGADPTAVNREGWNVLHSAAAGGHLEVVQMFASYHMLNDETNNGLSRGGGDTPLFLALREGHRAVWEALLQAGADPTAVNREGWNALHFAAQCCRLDVVQMLASDKRLLHARDNQGCTPLLLSNSKKTYEALLKAGADATVIDYEKRNALHHAAHQGHLDLVQMLACNKRMVIAKDRLGRTPLDLAKYFCRNSSRRTEVCNCLQEPDSACIIA